MTDREKLRNQINEVFQKRKGLTLQNFQRILAWVGLPFVVWIFLGEPVKYLVFGGTWEDPIYTQTGAWHCTIKPWLQGHHCIKKGTGDYVR